MIDCEKLFNLMRVDQEKEKGTIQVEKDWVKEGVIEFTDVMLRYRKNTEIVLNKLKFKIKAG